MENKNKFNLLKGEVSDTTAEEVPPSQKSRPEDVELVIEKQTRCRQKTRK